VAKYRVAVIELGRMGSTFDDEMAVGGSLFRPYCHGPILTTSSAPYSVSAGTSPAITYTRATPRCSKKSIWTSLA
jgi:hypothetical protein